VIGKFPNEVEKMKIMATIKNMGLEDKITFLGQIEREMLFSYYQQHDFTVFPSIWDEPFSRVPLESMACGTPCISTANPGCKELFNLNAPLILLDRTKNSLERILDAFTGNQDQYEKVSLEGRQFVEKSFTFDLFMRNIERTFLSCLDIHQDEQPNSKHSGNF
jgi:glycosyltransferase involved in cell wall biosynthesis